jgi:hypothetical protein
MQNNTTPKAEIIKTIGIVEDEVNDDAVGDMVLLLLLSKVAVEFFIVVASLLVFRDTILALYLHLLKWFMSASIASIYNVSVQSYKSSRYL